MILGRTPEGLIKIKKDDPLGLRAVNCSCCGGEPECCMYPAQGLADVDYGANDLPDAVTIGGVSYSRAGTSYGDTTNGVIFQGNVWAKYTSGVRSSRPCLIQGGVEDQFADTYTATSPGAETTTLTRESICVWKGPEPELYTLRYYDDSATTGFKCKWAFIDSVKDEGQFQNIPTGDYTQPEEENPWVIS